MLHVGIISDTHGRLGREAMAALTPCDLVLHAGDVGDPDILARLNTIAPVHAVRGNVDEGRWAEELPTDLSLDLEGIELLLYHGHLPPPGEHLARADVTVQGHSHRPAIDRRESVLHINPGSAGPKRFRLPVTVARLRVDGRDTDAELVRLE